MLALKKLYYEKYAKKSYSLSNIDVVIDYIFKGIKKGIPNLLFISILTSLFSFLL